MDAATTAVTASAVLAQGDAIVKAGFLVKKPPTRKGRSRKRYFELRESGLCTYYAAVSPDGEPVSEKGNFTIFNDSTIKVTAEGKASDPLTLTINTKAREWVLTAENASEASEWENSFKQVVKGSSVSMKDHIAMLQRRKAARGGVMAKLGGKVAGALATAKATMQSLGFAGSITVSGAIMGLSVSMGLGVEIEAEEGEIEIQQNRQSLYEKLEKEEIAGDDSEMSEGDDADGGDNSDADADGDNDADEVTQLEKASQEDSPAKESRFKRGMRKGMESAMGRVKGLAYTMKKYSLSGTIGVGVDLTMFGTGISIEFEIELSSAITDAEYEEMREHELEGKAAKKEHKLAKKASKQM